MRVVLVTPKIRVHQAAAACLLSLACGLMGVTGAGAHVVHDGLTCYRVKDSFKRITTSLGIVPDSTTGLPLQACAVQNAKARLLCVPSDLPIQADLIVDGVDQAIEHFDLEELARMQVCYRVRCLKVSPPVDIDVRDEFGARPLTNIRKAQLACKPAFPALTTTSTTTTTTIP